MESKNLHITGDSVRWRRGWVQQ